MTVQTMPSSPGFRDAIFGLESNSQAFFSIFTKAARTTEYPGARWRGQFTLPPMRAAQAAQWQAFLVKLRGQAGRFYAGDPDYAVAGPRGTAGGTGLVNGANQTGTALVTDGWTASQAALFRTGDYIAFDTASGRELKMITQDVASNGSGQATLVFEPPIRNSPADNAAIIKSNPTCIMMLEDPSISWSTDFLRMYGITFNAIEAL